MLTKENVYGLLVDHLDPVVSSGVVDDLGLDLLEKKHCVSEGRRGMVQKPFRTSFCLNWDSIETKGQGFKLRLFSFDCHKQKKGKLTK